MELDPELTRWLRLARFAALCSLLLFLVAVIVGAFLEARENGAENLLLTLWTVPLWLPYLWMYLQMRSAKRRKKGLALAVCYGAWALLITAPCALGSTGAALQGGAPFLLPFSFPWSYSQEERTKRWRRNQATTASSSLDLSLRRPVSASCV